MGIYARLRRSRRRSMDRVPSSDGVPGADADMDLLFEQARLLRELAGDQEQAADGDRVYDFSIRWGTLLHGRLQRLIHYDSRGELSTAEQARYAELRAELRDVAPLAERLGLVPPPVDR